MATAVLEQARKSVEQAPPAPRSVAQPFDDIMRRYSGMVYSRCLHITKNAADAEDATQAVFLTLSMHLQSSKQIKYVGPWLEQVAKRVSLNLIRSRKRRTRRENVVAEMRPPETIDPSQPDLDEVRAIIRDEVNQLPTKYRLPLILHYFGDTTTEEIAKEMGCTPNALCVRLHRGREMLRKRLQGRGVVMSVTGLGLAVAQTIRFAVSDHLASSILYTANTVATGSAPVAHVVGTHVATLAHAAIKPIVGTKLIAVGAFISLALSAGTWSGADRIHDVVQKVRQMNVPSIDAGRTLREVFRSAVPQLSDASQEKPADRSQPRPQVLPQTELAHAAPPSSIVESGESSGGGIPQVPVQRHGASTPTPSGAWAMSTPQMRSIADGHLPLPPVGNGGIATNHAPFKGPDRNLDGLQVASVDTGGPIAWEGGDNTLIDPGMPEVDPDMPGGPGAGFVPGIPLANGTGTYAWPSDDAVVLGDPYVQFTLTDVTDAAPMIVDTIARESFAELGVPDGHTFINIWTLGTTAEFSSADFLIHYDESLIQALGLDETKLKLWVFDGEWKRIDDGLNLDRDLIWGDVEGSGIGYVAISTPEPGAIMALGLGGSFLLMRRRRSK